MFLRLGNVKVEIKTEPLCLNGAFGEVGAEFIHIRLSMSLTGSRIILAWQSKVVRVMNQNVWKYMLLTVTWTMSFMHASMLGWTLDISTRILQVTIL